METKFGFDSHTAESDTVFFEARDERVTLCGFVDPRNDSEYRRVPADVAKATSDLVSQLAVNTAGGRVRFATDSPYVIIKSEMEWMADMAHFPRSGSSAFDFYIRHGDNYIFKQSFMPGGPEKGYEGKADIPYPGMNEVMINFPSYSPVTNLYIGVKDGSAVRPATEYKYKKPVVYYGSSITQGACACRPGNSYEAIISNELDCDYINLGFSGSARAEDAITGYIASLDMSVFVLDYDHNAPTPEYLGATHKKMFSRIREAQPTLPIVIVSMPVYITDGGVAVSPFDLPTVLRRRDIIKKTYDDAVAAGDKNVAFVDGTTLFDGTYPELCTVDTVHPNDAGFFCMAEKIGAAVKAFLK